MIYGTNLLGAAIALFIMQSLIIAAQGEGSILKRAVGKDRKGKASTVLYLTGIASAWFISESSIVPALLAIACFVGVAIMWLVPDRRMERVILERETMG